MISNSSIRVDSRANITAYYVYAEMREEGLRTWVMSMSTCIGSQRGRGSN